MPKYLKKYTSLKVVSKPMLLRHFNLLALLVCLTLGTVSCSQISLSPKSAHNLIRSSGNEETKGSLPNQAINLDGQWKIGFRYQGKVTTGVMQLKQSNQGFSGYGQEDSSGLTFKIDHGLVKGNEIIFLKRYESNPNQSVQYHGQFSLLSSENGLLPYMGGDFSIENNGRLSTGDWEAAMAVPVVNTDAVKTMPEENNKVEEAPPAENSVTNIPDLSGKWQAAFEYNFKTIHSTMFLEQDGSKITGHGIDVDSKNKFVIKRGWYNFPHLTLVRQYLATKQFDHLVPGREMTFKADVTVVSDKDYQGPYLSGKTQGGGNWEAERIQ